MTFPAEGQTRRSENFLLIVVSLPLLDNVCAYSTQRHVDQPTTIYKVTR